MPVSEHMEGPAAANIPVDAKSLSAGLLLQGFDVVVQRAPVDPAGIPWSGLTALPNEDEAKPKGEPILLEIECGSRQDSLRGDAHGYVPKGPE